MSNRLALCLVFISFTIAVSSPVVADATVQVVYDTVDFVEIKNQDICSSCNGNQSVVIVRGIPVGTSTPSTRTFNFGSNIDMATRCERLAMIAMSKPGKYQLGIGADTSTSGGVGGHGDCKLILVAP
jgi:hypothetical protein